MKSKKINRYFICAQWALVVLVLLIAVSNCQPSGETKRDSFQQNDQLEFTHEQESIKPNDRDEDWLIRNKRTVGFLRQLFPVISQEIDRKIQEITKVVFRIAGCLILRSGTASDGAAGGRDRSDGGEGNTTFTLPTFPTFEYDDKDDSSGSSATSGQTSSSSASGDADSTTAANTDAIGSTLTTPSTFAALSGGSTTPTTMTTGSNSPPNLEIDGVNEVNIRKLNRRDVSDVLSDSTSSVPTPVEDEVNTSESDKKNTNGLFQRLREMRNKRNPFKLGGALNGGDSGSGNFLFDVVRLISGSGVTPEKDEELNAPRDERQEDGSGGSNSGNDNSIPGTSDDTYGPGIPGPLTRLFILLNRGVSNMMQDLILRLAQTSERVINFKARLITSII